MVFKSSFEVKLCVSVIQCNMGKPDLGDPEMVINNWDGVTAGFGTSITYTCQVNQPKLFDLFEPFKS